MNNGTTARRLPAVHRNLTREHAAKRWHHSHRFGRKRLRGRLRDVRSCPDHQRDVPEALHGELVRTGNQSRVGADDKGSMAAAGKDVVAVQVSKVERTVE
jgi:hypothetical protein